MGFEDFMAGLDPKTAKRIKTAQETTVERLEFASHGLNQITAGGAARGHFTLIYGNQSAGKSLAMQQSVAKWQKEGLVCAWVDAEGVWEKDWASRLGVNNEELILIQTKSSGGIEKKLAPLMENGIDVVVIDSISDIMPEAFVDDDGAMKDQQNRKQMGAHAKAITALINGLMYLNEDRRTAVILLSQTTTFIGQTYVQQVPHGGKKVLFAASQIVKLTSSNTDAKQIKGNVYVGDLVLTRPIGRTVEAFCEKNKLGPQHRTCEYDIYYDGEEVGIDYVGEVIKQAIQYQILEKGGAWFNWGDQKWQGEKNVTKYFKENPMKLEEVLAEIHAVENGGVLD
jgi:recombination protein RecA